MSSGHPAVPLPLYTTGLGEAYAGDALAFLRRSPRACIDLVVTSPPFALVRKKAYGNEDEGAYADWFLPFAAEVGRALKPQGSFVLELGWAYRPGRPVRSLYNVQTLLRLCDEQQWLLVQEFQWWNPSKLPSPVEWVCRRRIRVKDAVSPVFWLAKTDCPWADWSQVAECAEGQARGDPSYPYQAVGLWDAGGAAPGAREQQEGSSFPTTLLRIANTDSNSWYLRACRALDLRAHPARFPARLPSFFIQGLTRPGDVVMDPFAGSNTVGAEAERLGRRWIALELNRDYLAQSAFRFVPDGDTDRARLVYERLRSQLATPPLHLGHESPPLPGPPRASLPTGRHLSSNNKRPSALPARTGSLSHGRAEGGVPGSLS